jgi:hypothetical protein
VNWTGRWLNKTALAQVGRIAEAGGPPHDLVLCYRDKSGGVAAREGGFAAAVSTTQARVLEATLRAVHDLRAELRQD